MQDVLDSFRSQGFATVPSVLSADEIREIFVQIEEVLDHALQNQGVDIEQFEGPDDKYLYLKEHHPIIKSHCYDLLGRLDSVRSAVTSKKIIDIGRQVFGTALLIGPVQVRIDDPGNDRLLPLHQEMEQISLFTFTVWIPLVDLADDSGGLRLLPGSHRQGIFEHQKTDGYPNYWALPRKVIDESKIEEVRMRRGDGLVFHPFLFHGSNLNNSSKTRWTLIARWSELTHVPYLRHEDAPLVMARHPDPKEPGNDFVKQYQRRSKPLATKREEYGD